MRKAILVATLALFGCAAGPRSPDDSAALARELATRVAGEPRTCISRFSTQVLTIVDSRTLIQRSGDAIWVNRLNAECPGLRPDVTLIVESLGDRYCRGDRVRGLERGTSIAGPICVLNAFTPYRRS